MYIRSYNINNQFQRKNLCSKTILNSIFWSTILSKLTQVKLTESERHQFTHPIQNKPQFNHLIQSLQTIWDFRDNRQMTKLSPLGNAYMFILTDKIYMSQEPWRISKIKTWSVSFGERKLESTIKLLVSLSIKIC